MRWNEEPRETMLASQIVLLLLIGSIEAIQEVGPRLVFM